MLIALLFVAAAALLVPAQPAHADTIRAQQWQLGFLRVRDAWKQSTGKGITVAVLDSGVDANHPDLKGQVLPGADFVDGTTDGRVDYVGHGTTVSALIAGHNDANGVVGIAYDAKILPVRVLDRQNRYESGDVVARAVMWAVDRGAQVINLSLGSAEAATALSEAIQYAFQHDVVVVACDGNLSNKRGTLVWHPAREPGVLAVSGVTAQGRFWDGSLQGPATVLAAPAANITGANPGGNYWNVQGTSFASPIVAASAALVRARFPSMSSANVVNRLVQTAWDFGAPGRDGQFGYGIVNPARALTANVPPVRKNPLLTTTALTGKIGRAPGGGPDEPGSPNGAGNPQTLAPPTDNPWLPRSAFALGGLGAILLALLTITVVLSGSYRARRSDRMTVLEPLTAGAAAYAASTRGNHRGTHRRTAEPSRPEPPPQEKSARPADALSDAERPVTDSTRPSPARPDAAERPPQRRDAGTHRAKHTRRPWGSTRKPAVPPTPPPAATPPSDEAWEQAPPPTVYERLRPEQLDRTAADSTAPTSATSPGAAAAAAREAAAAKAREAEAAAAKAREAREAAAAKAREAEAAAAKDRADEAAAQQAARDDTDAAGPEADESPAAETASAAEPKGPTARGTAKVGGAGVPDLPEGVGPESLAGWLNRVQDIARSAAAAGGPRMDTGFDEHLTVDLSQHGNTAPPSDEGPRSRFRRTDADKPEPTDDSRGANAASSEGFRSKFRAAPPEQPAAEPTPKPAAEDVAMPESFTEFFEDLPRLNDLDAQDAATLADDLDESLDIGDPETTATAMLQAILEGLKKEPKPATPPVDDAAPPAASADEAAPTLPQRSRRPSPRPSGRKPKSDAAPPKAPEPDNAPTADAAEETEPAEAAEPAKAARLVEAVAADPGIEERAPEAAVADAPAVEAASPAGAAGDGPEQKSGWWSTAARRVTGANRKAERTEPVSAPPERPTVKQPIDRGPEEPAAAGTSAPTEAQPPVDAVTEAPTPTAAAPDGPDDAAPPTMDAAPDTAPTTTAPTTTAPTTDAPTEPGPTGDAPRDTGPTTGTATDSAPAEPASDGPPRGGMLRGLRTGLRWLRGGRDTASADERPTAEDPPPAEPATVDAAAGQPTS